MDTSALVKLYVPEEGSDIVRNITNSEAFYTTPFCFYETLTQLKVACLYRKILTRDEYDSAVWNFIAWYSSSQTLHDELDMTTPEALHKVQVIAKKHNLDISDAFQILSVKEGRFHRMALDSATVLVTADEALASAARKEGIKAWNCLKEPAP